MRRMNLEAETMGTGDQCCGGCHSFRRRQEGGT
jgi:hypothetical protein